MNDLSRALRIDDLTKSFGPALANDGISLRVEPGEVYGLLGANGAGKSTLVKQVIGLLRPDAGSIILGTHDLVADPDAARQLCSYLPQAPVPIDSLRAREAVDLIGRIRGGDRDAVRQRRGELFEALDIAEWTDVLGARLSGGVRRLVGFAMVSVSPAPVVILDEPTNDVDPLRRRLLWDQVSQLAESGVAVLLVTHNVLEAEKAVDRLAIISGGRLLAEGTPSSMKSADRERMRLQVMLQPAASTPAAPAFVTEVVRSRNRLLGLVDQGDVSDAVCWARDLMAAEVAEEYAIAATTLEDVYIRFTGEATDPVESVGR